ncbi:hypothetical protein SCWH03_08440 [Streptomyces pacificus]|uniref:PPM-type phosphatase domain-containing protein n=1 Tax=Streptomyces pacificus TaxID=2705029 RepID=A0A6A0ANS7_9ACTN|nr:hypothetical protein SCWH03_08440 [Streptomyces pacificus]
MEEGTARLVRAGPLHPVIRHPDGSTGELPVGGGPPLGVPAGQEYPMTEAGLVPGTLPALVTDGLVESAALPVEEGCAGCATRSPRPTPPTPGGWPTNSSRT